MNGANKLKSWNMCCYFQRGVLFRLEIRQKFLRKLLIRYIGDIEIHKLVIEKDTRYQPLLWHASLQAHVCTCIHAHVCAHIHIHKIILESYLLPYINENDKWIIFKKLNFWRIYVYLEVVKDHIDKYSRKKNLRERKLKQKKKRTEKRKDEKQDMRKKMMQTWFDYIKFNSMKKLQW